MTFNQFLNTLFSGVNLFLDSLQPIVIGLLNNYIFLTILGIVIVVSIIKYIFSLIFNPLVNTLEDLDNPNGTSFMAYKAIDDVIDNYNKKVKTEKARRRFGFHIGGK